MPISHLEFQMMQQRTEAALKKSQLTYDTHRALADRGDACEQESELHQQILDYARQHEWVIVHSRMDRASTVGVGVADFVFLIQEGKTLVIECKRLHAKCTPAQLGFIAHCVKNGHRAYIVRSFSEFLELVKV